MHNRAIVSVTNDLYTDQRLHKICTFLVDQGYEVLLVGRKKRDSVNLSERRYRTARMRLLFETGALFYASFNVRLFFFLLFRKADILVSNDLDTLLANFMAKKFKRKCRLVYDSHEFFTEVPELIDRPRVQKIWLGIERRIFPKLDSIYTVNQSIAEIYQGLYKKDVKVVRNISPLWNPGLIKSKAELGIPENKMLIIMQGAGINIHRGAEEAVVAMKDIDAVLMIVGSGDVIAALKGMVQEFKLQSKVLFFGKRPYDELMNYTWHASIGLTLDKPNNLNYKFSLPNKVFDYIHTQTPIITSNVVEVARVVNQYKIGIVLDEFSVPTLSNAINELIKNPERLHAFKENCKMAAQSENWEKECNVLNSIYPKVG